MTTEDDFQRALDANPKDWQCRLVFADFLEERGDPHAEGYRALGVLRRWSWHDTETDVWCWFQLEPDEAANNPDDLPNDLFRSLEGVTPVPWMEHATRREAEDAAASAFAKLPAGRRAELLTLQAV